MKVYLKVNKRTVSFGVNITAKRELYRYLEKTTIYQLLFLYMEAFICGYRQEKCLKHLLLSAIVMKPDQTFSNKKKITRCIIIIL